MDKFLEIKRNFEAKADKERSAAMRKYMRDLFDFYGIPTPERKEIYHDFIKSEKRAKAIDRLGFFGRVLRGQPQGISIFSL